MAGRAFCFLQSLVLCFSFAHGSVLGPHVSLTAAEGYAVASGGLPLAGEKGRDELSARDLPREARETLQLIRKGGPFPYAKDGTVFGNREAALPHKPRGYYHEYTVRTPGSRDRGARRIIAGAGGEFYYTDDHYRSFKRIRE